MVRLLSLFLPTTDSARLSVPVFLLLSLKSIKQIMSQLELGTLAKDLIVGSALYLCPAFSSHPGPCFLPAGYISWAQLWQLNVSRHGKVSPLQKNNFLLRTPDLILSHLSPLARQPSSLFCHGKESSEWEVRLSKSYTEKQKKQVPGWPYLQSSAHLETRCHSTAGRSQ